MEETDGRGADVVYVCAPSVEAQEIAIALSAPRGRVNLFGGLPKGSSTIRFDANILHYKELFLAGASSSLPDDNREALRLISSGKISAAALVTAEYPIDEIAAAFARAESRTGIKVVVSI